MTLEGLAELFDGQGPDGAYLGKYADEIRALGSEADDFAGAYSVRIRITPTRARVY